MDWNTLLQDFERAFNKLLHDLERVFLEKARWVMLLKGLRTTLYITLAAAVLGLLLGFLIAAVRASYDKNAAAMRARKNRSGLQALGFFGLRTANALSKLYLTIFRGTPVTVQLVFIYFVIFASSPLDKMFVAMLAFGLNSGAYVAEIIRAGIMSVDDGQMEAGRSLGFSYPQTMVRVILPQALKNTLPALGNEIIVLLKETSVAGYIAITDLTRVGTQIRSQTYLSLLPLLSVALIYLILVIGLSRLVTLLERRLRASDH